MNGLHNNIIGKLNPFTAANMVISFKSSTYIALELLFIISPILI
jgi:hypothetical protein